MPLGKTAGLFASAFLVIVSSLLPSPAAAAGVACGAQASWFTGIPAVPTYEPQSACQFQQWAWQAFLGLLQTDGSHPIPLYLTWPLPKDSIATLYCESLCQSAAQQVRNRCVGPPTQEVVNATTQPGFVPSGTSGELIDQAGQPVYFTAHVSPAWVQFVTRRQLYDNRVLEAASSHLAFRAGAFEIKSSWRLTRGMTAQEKAQYYVVKGCVIPELAGAVSSEEDIALVGFHITGGAPGHPELLWATFEHVRNAPDCEDTPASGTWAFYDGRTNCNRGTDCNQPNPTSAPPGELGHPINVCRKFPYGGASPQVARQIAALNQDVHDRLPRNSIWRNYELVGTVWGVNSTPKGAPTFNLQEPSGSPLLSNTTLETFKQNVSCFGCHSAQFPGEFAPIAGSSPAVNETKDLYVSHVVLFPLFFAARGCSSICEEPPPGAVRQGRH
jgi:hypothetical protein